MAAKPTSTTVKYTLLGPSGDVYAQSTTSTTFTIATGAVAGTYTAGNGGETIVDNSSTDTTVVANNSGDTITGGGSGHYTFIGGNGKDFLTGGAQNDILNGGNGSDSVAGGGGADNITGGNGGDFLTGGTGADKFIYGSYLESVYQLGHVDNVNAGTLGTAPFDVITDFNSSGPNEGDKLDLSALDSQLSGGGTTKLVWYGAQGTDASAGGTNAGLHHGVWTDLAGHFVYADVNNDGKADLKIQVSNVDGSSFIGVDHAPIISGGTFAGSVTELADTTGSSATDNSTPPGVVNFTDADDTDTHTAGFVADASNTTSYGTFALGALSEGTYNLAHVQTADGHIGWSFGVTDSAIDFLAVNESIIQKYDVTITDNWGASATQVVTVTINGVNDDVVVTSGAQSGGATEIADGAVGENVDDHKPTGTITYTDADNTDTHTASATAEALGYLGSFDLDQTAIDTGNGGSVGWTFTVNDSALDYLGAGETLDQYYDVKIDDSHGGDQTDVVHITLTGTNDDAIISLGLDDADTGSVTEDANSGGLGIEITSGTLSYADVDLIDTHTLTVTGGTYGTLSFDSPIVDTTGTGTGGVIGWNYSVNDTAIDSLNTGDVQQDVFTVDLFDGTSHVTHVVTITINGFTDVVGGPVVSPPFTGGGDPNDFDNLGVNGANTVAADSGVNLVYGGTGNDILNGGGGADTIYGGSGNDTIHGQSGTDLIFGGSGADTIDGQNQNDTIIGGYGADTITGGNGIDTIRYLDIKDTGDTINGFVAGVGGDKLDFSAIDATPPGGDDAFALFADTAVHAHSINYFQSGANTIVWADTDGNVATVELAVTLAGVTAANLTSADNFIL